LAVELTISHMMGDEIHIVNTNTGSWCPENSGPTGKHFMGTTAHIKYGVCPY